MMRADLDRREGEGGEREERERDRKTREEVVFVVAWLASQLVDQLSQLAG